MPSPDEKEILIQLAEIRQQVVSMLNSVEEVKSSVKEVLTLDRAVAELVIYHKQQSQDIDKQRAATEANHDAIEAVERKADEWINKGRGAWATVMILGSMAQAVILSAIFYTFNHLRTAEDSLLLMDHRIQLIEQRHKDNPRS